MTLQVTLPELSRDLVLLAKGDSITVQTSTALAQAGWEGGQFAKWVYDASGFPTVGMSDGRYCGFFIFGSDEMADQFTAYTQQNVVYQYVVLQFGGNVFYTNTYEQYGYLARHGLGPMVPLVYSPQDALYVSENGRVTTENESDQAAFPPHNFPDGTPVPDLSFQSWGSCAVGPSAATNQYICCLSVI